MNQQEIRTFVETYFKAHQSEFVEEDEAYFSVRLPVEVDKDLGNRPFYWTYVEKIGIEPNPLTLTFVFDRERTPEGIRGEDLPFGSRRLHQIFESSKKHGKYIRLYEESSTAMISRSLQSPLIPWLAVNYKIEFICDQKRDVLLPLGINLVSGTILNDFYNQVRSKPLTPKLPDFSFTMQPVYTPDRAADHLESYINHFLQQQDSAWAVKARERLEEEKSFVESYYSETASRQASTESLQAEEIEEKNRQLAVERENRLNELEWQFEPRIKVNALNAGLFYLRSNLSNHIM